MVVLRNIDNDEIFENIVDKCCSNILLHNFNPHESIKWLSTSININKDILLENVLVRNMCFDLQIDIYALKKILSIDRLYLNIYQFNRPIPNTLLIDHLPENNREKILRQNGLEHIIWIELEDTIVMSYNADFLKKIRENKTISDRIII